jgi:hypothetical protein
MMESPVQCECYAHAAPGFFSLAGTAVKASGTDAQLDAAGSVLWGLGSFPNKQKIAFVSRKPCLQKSEKRFERVLNARFSVYLEVDKCYT